MQPLECLLGPFSAEAWIFPTFLGTSTNQGYLLSSMSSTVHSGSCTTCGHHNSPDRGGFLGSRQLGKLALNNFKYYLCRLQQ